MTDFGHDLSFGAFVTPSALDPQQPVALAQVAEDAGLDLVTFQDHPYQPRFLETWTLMSYAAAGTSRITLAPNVANLQLRPPAVLARAAASLDLLSGGRVALGLGAGGFGEAAVAMGAEPQSPAEGVRSVEESIQIMRMLWDTTERSGARLDGTRHRLTGAKRGPAPAHGIPIWVGALGDRMLGVTARLADGWLPSLGRLGVDGLAARGAVLDEAARTAGRDPAEIRRLLNVGLRDGDGVNADVLADLATRQGFSTFILASDDPDAIEGFASRVAPAVRSRVGR
jgi:alkanesulfonate monooxygenase SsuD/methylene tetrahydromethanopterin reductase-like flavin-dependent oxidoreductase (luciferase family)